MKCLDFINFIKNIIKSNVGILTDIEKNTRDQSTNNVWFELRYGRITASKAYEVSKCNTTDGVLVKQILGCTKLKITNAMKRGTILEEHV